MPESVLNKVTELKNCKFIREDTPTQVLFCGYCEIFKNSFFYGTVPVNDSEMNTGTLAKNVKQLILCP